MLLSAAAAHCLVTSMSQDVHERVPLYLEAPTQVRPSDFSPQRSYFECMSHATASERDAQRNKLDVRDGLQLIFKTLFCY